MAGYRPSWALCLEPFPIPADLFLRTPPKVLAPKESPVSPGGAFAFLARRDRRLRRPENNRLLEQNDGDGEQ